MTTIAFIGLGNMGNPMAANLVKAGHTVLGFDLMPQNLETAKANGVAVAASAAEAVKGADAVVTMLPAGKHAGLGLLATPQAQPVAPQPVTIGGYQ